jgi:hypothetical protein
MVKYRRAALVEIYERRLRMKLRRLKREDKGKPRITWEGFKAMETAYT